MTLHELADELIEIRRYVRSHPEHVKEELKKLWCGNAPFGPLGDMIEHETTLRFVRGFWVALRHVVVDPEILEGYLYGAAAEIREMAVKQEDGK